MDPNPCHPPRALTRQWWDDATFEHGESLISDMGRRAARWGAQTQLQLCQAWLQQRGHNALAEAMTADFTVLCHPEPCDLLCP